MLQWVSMCVVKIRLIVDDWTNKSVVLTKKFNIVKYNTCLPCIFDQIDQISYLLLILIKQFLSIDNGIIVFLLALLQADNIQAQQTTQGLFSKQNVQSDEGKKAARCK